MSNDTGRSRRCESSHNRFLPADMKGGIGGKFGEPYASSSPVQLPKQTWQPIDQGEEGGVGLPFSLCYHKPIRNPS